MNAKKGTYNKSALTDSDHTVDIFNAINAVMLSNGS